MYLPTEIDPYTGQPYTPNVTWYDLDPITGEIIEHFEQTDDFFM